MRRNKRPEFFSDPDHLILRFTPVQCMPGRYYALEKIRETERTIDRKYLSQIFFLAPMVFIHLVSRKSNHSPIRFANEIHRCTRNRICDVLHSWDKLFPPPNTFHAFCLLLLAPASIENDDSLC